MHLEDKITTFTRLACKIDNLSERKISEFAQVAQQHNGWFNMESVKNALEGIAFMLEERKLKAWLKNYKVSREIPRTVGIVMAGNIPLVGFHDLLCVLASGHRIAIKLSSQDTALMQQMVNWLIEIEPRLEKNIEFRNKLTHIDAVIATGSDNTARYFAYYFRSIPHIIRKNRTSVAVLTGNETQKNLHHLGNDIFCYFGLGCRNVSKVLTPAGYDLREIFPHWNTHQSVIYHHKYKNNYDYYKSIFLLNKTPFLDTGFLLAIPTHNLISPISVLYHQEYKNEAQLNSILNSCQEKLQCIVSKKETPFGKTQRPELWDYPDNIDVMEFLANLQ